MIDTREDQPAFPRSYTADGHNGMTLRDYFASKVLSAAMSGATGLSEASLEDVRKVFEDVAMFSYLAADAMLAERAKGSTVGEQNSGGGGHD